MNRDEVIRTLQRIGANLAAEYGFENVDTREDREGGLWGEGMVRALEKKYGPCSEEINWYGEDRKEQRIQFRFRFENPCISIKIPGEVFAELEISDFNYEEKKHDGDFHIGQGMFWKDEGAALLRMLIDRWYEELKENIKEEQKHGL